MLSPLDELHLYEKLDAIYIAIYHSGDREQFVELIREMMKHGQTTAVERWMKKHE